MVQEYLRCCGWEVDAVRSPAEARRLLETRGYSAVITDLRFSGPASSEGFSIAHLARTYNPQAPVVVMTGYFSAEAEAQARRLGVDAFVPKPVPLWELARLVPGLGGRTPALARARRAIAALAEADGVVLPRCARAAADIGTRLCAGCRLRLGSALVCPVRGVC